MTAVLYAAYHKSAPIPDSKAIIPIHVGRAHAAAPLPGMIGDDTGDNISDRNSSYCELTALYWAWKNAPAEAERIGLIHYRRLLDLTGQFPGGMVEQSPDTLHLPDWSAKTDAWLKGPGQEADLVIPRLHEMGQTVAGNYASRHREADFQAARAAIVRDHPDMAEDFDRVSAGRKLRLGNLMLMRRPLFDRYCGWLFGILAEVEAKAPRGAASPDQGRFIGFLAERLLTVFVAHLQRVEPGLKIREVSIVNLADTLVTPYLTDEALNGPDNINIAFASDRTYLPHAAAMVQSVLSRVDPARQINLFYLHTRIGERGRSMLRDLVAETHPKAQLHEIDIGSAFESAHRSASRGPSNATYARFLLFRLLPRLDRLLYLDCDVIARADVAPLFDADLGGAQIGGVPDWIMTRTLTGPTPTADPEVPDLCAYHRDVLGLSDDQIATYLNAGVMLFDFSAMDDVAATGARLIDMAETGRYLFRDQDILNTHFKGKLATLDPRWNVFNCTAAAYTRVPRPGHDKAMAARRDPWIVHYADAGWKPWSGTASPRAQDYWQALIQTPFYAEVLTEMQDATREDSLGRRAAQRVVQTGQALAEKVPALRGPLLRIYAALGRPGRK